MEFLAGNRIIGTDSEKTVTTQSNANVTGGDNSYIVGTKTYRKFTTTGSSNLVIGDSSIDLEVLLVGGGGGGGGETAGGGGAGGLLYQASRTMTAATYPIVIGTGGAPSTGRTLASNGVSSTFNGASADGGGGGGGQTVSGASGGSGGGAGQGGSGGAKTQNDSSSMVVQVIVQEMEVQQVVELTLWVAIQTHKMVQLVEMVKVEQIIQQLILC